MIVDSLLPDPRRAGSTRVVVDGHVAWTVPTDVIEALGLQPGSTLRGDAMERLGRAADEEGAFRAGLRALERRGHAERELAVKLERKGHAVQGIRDAVARLQRLGLLDDRAFARHFAAAKRDRGRGPVRLRHDLLRLGVDRALVDAVLRELQADTDDPLAQPRALVATRARQLAGCSRDARRRRLLAFLARRGFRGHEAHGLVSEVLHAGDA
jgi:regulatory protein